MCGRYTLRRYELARACFEALRAVTFDEFSELHIHWWNIAPSQHVPVVRIDSDGQRVIACAQWGFIPAWARELPKVRPINARAETAATSGLFRRAFQSRRCLIPADGYYEWQGIKPPKQPYFIHLKDDGIFAFAGLWERWKSPEDTEPIDTCTILTTQPNELMTPIHNRMPVVVAPRDYGRWLDSAAGGNEVADILKPYPAQDMDAYPVAPAVNSPKNNGPELVRRLR